jgi:aminoglycoside 6-adenylyltransferase
MVLFDDGTKVDFGIWPLVLMERSREAGQLPGEFDTGYRILLDKDDVAGALPPPTHTAFLPHRPTHDEYQSLIEEFWFVTTYVAKYLWRDELVPVKTILDYELKYLVLLKLFEWRIGIDYDWSVKPGFFGRGLGRYLAAATWAQFEETFVGPDRPANWTALYTTIDLFRRVATSVGEALGFIYPRDVDTKMMAYLRQIEQLGDTPTRDRRG